MANTVGINCYQLNNRVFDRDSPQKFGFPTSGCLLADVSGSPTRSLSSGYNVYGLITTIANGNQYYVAETIAQLLTAFG